MLDEKTKEVIEMTARKSATILMNQLRDKGRIKNHPSNSFKKTEEVLRLYPNLPDHNDMKQKIDKALSKLESVDDYKDLIQSRYFDGSKYDDLAELYDTNYTNILRVKNKHIKILAAELFPEDVLKEILEK